MCRFDVVGRCYEHFSAAFHGRRDKTLTWDLFVQTSILHARRFGMREA